MIRAVQVRGRWPRPGSGVDPEFSELVVDKPTQLTPAWERDDNTGPKLDRFAAIHPNFSTPSQYDERLVGIELVLDPCAGCPVRLPKSDRNRVRGAYRVHEPARLLVPFPALNRVNVRD